MRVVIRNREQLLHDAAGIFYQSGYDALSFGLLARHMNCTQRMLCDNFRDRETLLTEIIRIYGYRHLSRAVSVLLRPEQCSLRRRLIRFAVQLLMVLRDDEKVLGIFRRILSDIHSKELTELLYEAGLRQMYENLTNVIDSAMQRREIRIGDPHLLSIQFYALVNNFIGVNLLIKGHQRVSFCQIRKSAKDSVDLFLNGALPLNSKKECKQMGNPSSV